MDNEDQVHTCDCSACEEIEINKPIENAIGYALNNNLVTNYKRMLIKDLIDFHFTKFMEKENYLYIQTSDKENIINKYKENIESTIAKIVEADSGLDAVTIYKDALITLMSI